MILIYMYIQYYEVIPNNLCVYDCDEMIPNDYHPQYNYQKYKVSITCVMTGYIITGFAKNVSWYSKAITPYDVSISNELANGTPFGYPIHHLLERHLKVIRGASFSPVASKEELKSTKRW